ncbi:uncharacterized protein SPSK_05768 [Sporothrix schenckii 1099-18]|uniref:Uncharacterized protein n=2 Tax=Sporothrix schenckii TaxID=29908 RepID=U7Q5D4_SPOS1|nr:uncharacterized protein SPSK_05768 [Sporothrix schenckii 1099-18]ERT02245.1 hypothetical protein HMPREF1624_00543 [Sporothrix schenckii ATCC 58251]KJR80520.1 hypothetical protein SPSK_05768 [Sporothrix schenckii 1099-18]
MNASQQVAAVAGRSSATSAATAGGKIVPPPPITVKASTTESFLKDFTLVAEAAKRAQVAVMMRDFENVGLSG